MRAKSTLFAVTLVAALAVTPAVSANAAAKSFANCDALHAVYPHGVAKSGAHDIVRGKSKPVTSFKVSTAIYNANKKSDRDGDGVACES